MRAAVIHGPDDLRLDELPVREPGPDEILVRTLSASICNATDVHIWQGEIGEELRPPYPHVLGHERAGEVVEVGADVDGFSVGDRVACWAKMDGAFAEYDLLEPSAYPMVKLGDAVSDDVGSLLEFVGATMRGLHAARLAPGERVLILGMGVQGLTLVQQAKRLGAERVAGLDLLPLRLRKAAELGADVTYDLTGRRYAEALADLRSAMGELDLVIDATGAGRWEGGNVVNLSLELLRWGGRYLAYSLPTRDIELNVRLLGMKGITLKGIDTPPDAVRRLLAVGERWAGSGDLRLEALVTHRVPLERVGEGLELCRDRPGEVLKVMVDVD